LSSFYNKIIWQTLSIVMVISAPSAKHLTLSGMQHFIKYKSSAVKGTMHA